MQLRRSGLRLLLLGALTLGALSVPAVTFPTETTAAPGPRTAVDHWRTQAIRLTSGQRVSAPVRVWTDRRAARRIVRVEVRRPGGRWVVQPRQRTGPRGWTTVRWSPSKRAEGTYAMRVRVLPRGTGTARVPGALTRPRVVRVVRATTHPETIPLLRAWNEARGQGRRCGDDWYPAQPPLRAQADLRVAAQRHAEDMARHDYFSHTGRNGSDVEDRTRAAGYPHPAGENLAGGQPTPADAVAAWLKSPGHCVNVMWPHYRTIGLGYSPRVDDSTYQAYWVANLGTR